MKSALARLEKLTVLIDTPRLIRIETAS